MTAITLKLPILATLFVVLSTAGQTQVTVYQNLSPRQLELMHEISSHDLFGWVEQLVSEEFAGRLTGHAGYDKAAAWVVSLFEEWGIEPGGEHGEYHQYFPHAYTWVYPRCSLTLHVPVANGMIHKHYLYEDEFIPGATSGSGSITAEVVYAGYGITAPELGYDDYAGLDVQGKIVLVEREVPVSTSDPESFIPWRPYSFHHYKKKNAVAQGAAGLLMNYGPIVNPNNAYVEGFLSTQVGPAVVADLFEGTGRQHEEVLQKIRETLTPQSFATGKQVTITNVTEHFPDARGSNVIGWIPGSDENLRNEVIIIGAHLDHTGYCYEMMPGANDNASGVAVLLGVARALSQLETPLRRSVLFLLFGAEEQGLIGANYYLERPVQPLENTLCLINLDSVGAGDKLGATAGENYPELWEVFVKSNEAYVHRPLRTNYSSNIGRPRTDAAVFMHQGIPSLSFWSYGTPSFYHTTQDNLDIITPEIMEDLGKLVFISLIYLDEEDEVSISEVKRHPLHNREHQ